jgi:hypothetical protein
MSDHSADHSAMRFNYRDRRLRPRMRRLYPATFAILDSARALGNAYQRESSRQLSADSAIRRVANTLFVRLYNLLCSATILIEEGYSLEANAQVRMMLEILFDAAYIWNTAPVQREAMAQRFIDYQVIAQHRKAERAVELGITIDQTKMDIITKNKEDVWDNVYGKAKNPRELDNWSGLSHYKKAQAGNIEDVYLREYHLLSDVIHNSPEAWRKMVREAEGGSVAYLIGPRERIDDLPALAAAFYFCQTVELLASLRTLQNLQPAIKRAVGRISRRVDDHEREIEAYQIRATQQ